MHKTIYHRTPKNCQQLSLSKHVKTIKKYYLTDRSVEKPQIIDIESVKNAVFTEHERSELRITTVACIISLNQFVLFKP